MLFLTDFIEVLALQCIQFCRMMYKDHLDEYHLFVEGVEKVIEWLSFNWWYRWK